MAVAVRPAALPLPFNPSLLRRTMSKGPATHRSLSSQSKPKGENYSWEITYNMLLAEGLNLPGSDYMKIQTEVSGKTRAILVDWLIVQHSTFKFSPETLFLCVSLLDRFLSIEHLPKSKVQLLGLATLLIACKYEEVQIPSVGHFLELVDSGYTAAELLGMERRVLMRLDFHITRPSAYSFFTRAVSLLQEDAVTTHLGQYLLELTLVEYSFLDFKPSLMACTALYLARKLRSRSLPLWSEVLEKQFNYKETDLQKCGKALFRVWQSAETYVLQALRTKFASGVYHEVARMKLSPRK